MLHVIPTFALNLISSIYGDGKRNSPCDVLLIQVYIHEKLSFIIRANQIYADLASDEQWKLVAYHRLNVSQVFSLSKKSSSSSA